MDLLIRREEPEGHAQIIFLPIDIRLVLPIAQGVHLAKEVLAQTEVNDRSWRLSLALILNEFRKLVDSPVFNLYEIFSLAVLLDICVELFLEEDDCFIPFIDVFGHLNHDVHLLVQDIPKFADLHLVGFDLLPLLVNFLHLVIILLSDGFLSLFQRDPELWGVLKIGSAHQNLGVHGLNLLLK